MSGRDSQSSRSPLKVEEDDADDLTERLSRIPGREYISSRPGPGGKKVYYLSGEKSTCLANEIFGTNGWSCSVQSVSVDELVVTEGGIKVMASAVVRVTCLCPNKYGQLAWHEDIGTHYAQMPVKSQLDVGKQKADAVDHAKKSAITDGRKRALRQFGNAVGLFLTDTDAVKASLQQQSEMVSYSIHRKSMSVSRMNTPSDVGRGGNSSSKRGFSEMQNGGHYISPEEQLRLKKALETTDWDSFTVENE